jgi:hypothetical protein
MTIYRLEGRIGRLIVGGVFGIAGLGLLILALLAAVGPDASASFAIAALFGGLVVLVVVFAMVRQVVEIRLADRGTIDFIRPIGTTRVTARDIRVLEGKLGSSYGETTWSLCIHHAGGSMTFGQFERVMDFVGQIRAQNPSVEISGVWPMGPP